MMRQLRLFTYGGRPYRQETENAELRVMILDHLAEVYHVWDGAGRKPLSLKANCPECGGKDTAIFVHPFSLFTVAYCRECGWFRELRLKRR